MILNFLPVQHNYQNTTGILSSWYLQWQFCFSNESNPINI